jgi:hypothetical protein
VTESIRIFNNRAIGFSFGSLTNFGKICSRFCFLVNRLTVFTTIDFSSILEGLMRQCMNSVPQYGKAYPAPRPDVSKSLEKMIRKGFPLNQSIIWHKRTHGQKRYYWFMKPTDENELRVKLAVVFLVKLVIIYF